MIIAIVQIALAGRRGHEELVRLFEGAAPRYRNYKGLRRKYYLLNETETGGVFFWDSRADAEAAFADAGWRKLIADRYGTEPKITYYDAPVMVDAASGEILVGESVAI